MPGKIQARNAAPAPVPLLFFMADAAVGQALDRRYPGRFAPVLADPLGGPGSARLLRWITGGYGPVIRLAPWLWGGLLTSGRSRARRGPVASRSRARRGPAAGLARAGHGRRAPGPGRDAKRRPGIREEGRRKGPDDLDADQE